MHKLKFSTSYHTKDTIGIDSEPYGSITKYHEDKEFIVEYLNKNTQGINEYILMRREEEEEIKEDKRLEYNYERETREEMKRNKQGE